MSTPTAFPDVDSPPAAGAAGGASGLAAWVRLVVGSLCQSALATLVFFALWAALPAVIGWEPTTVSSGSMMPRLRVGDVAVAKPLDGPPALRQVLLFDDPDHPGRLRLHRFVRVDDEGRMVTRGDANDSDDSSPVDAAALRGVAVLRIPGVALPIVWLREGRWVELGVASAVLVLLLTGSRLPRTPSPPSSGPRDRGPGGGAGRRSPRSPGRRPLSGRPGRPAGAVTAAVAVTTLLGTTGLVAAAPAWASWTGRTSNPNSTYAAATYYRCSSVVLPQNPFLYYQLAETSGTLVNDRSANGRDGTLVGGYAVGTSDVCSTTATTAITMNGTSSYIATPTQLTAPDTFTVQVWFKTTTARGGRLIGFGSARTGASGTADRNVYMTNAGRLVFGVQTGNNQRQTITTGNAYNDGSWHLVTAVLTPTGMRLQVDDTSTTIRSATTNAVSYPGYWRIGYDDLTGWTTAPTSNYFAGTVSQVAVYSSALSDQTIANLYAAGRS